MKVHERGQVKCRVRVPVRIRCTLRVMDRVRFNSHKAPGMDPTAEQLSLQRAHSSTQGRMPVRISLWVPWPDKCMGHP